MAVRVALDALEVALVATLRSQGCTWVELAAILGVTPQCVGKRHRAAGRGRMDRADDKEPFIPPTEEPF
jgi:predicted transcriptional regulator